MKMPGRMLMQVLLSVFKKPATVCYPFVKVRMRERFRGKLVFDYSKCIGCKLCMRDCPTAAINIRKVGDKLFEAEIDLSRCIYCAQCVDSCPKAALQATREFELASLDRQSLKTVFHAEKTAKNQCPFEKPQDAKPADAKPPEGTGPKA